MTQNPFSNFFHFWQGLVILIPCLYSAQLYPSQPSLPLVPIKTIVIQETPFTFESIYDGVTPSGTKFSYLPFSCEEFEKGKPQSYDPQDKEVWDENFKEPKTIWEFLFKIIYDEKTHPRPKIIEFSHGFICEKEPLGFYGRPNGCTAVPDWGLDYIKSCNTHDLCFLMLLGQKKLHPYKKKSVSLDSFNSQFNFCKEIFRKDLISACVKDGYPSFYCKFFSIVSRYPDGPYQFMGMTFEQSFLVSQIFQADYIRRLIETMKQAKNLKFIDSIESSQNRFKKWCRIVRKEMEQKHSEFIDQKFLEQYSQINKSLQDQLQYCREIE